MNNKTDLELLIEYQDLGKELEKKESEIEKIKRRMERIEQRDKKMLDLTIEPYDLNKKMTIREYIRELVYALLTQEEDFNGKRPFGESGWRHFIEEALIESGHLKGKVNEPGYGCSFEQSDFDKLMERMVKRL